MQAEPYSKLTTGEDRLGGVLSIVAVLRLPRTEPMGAVAAITALAQPPRQPDRTGRGGGSPGRAPVNELIFGILVASKGGAAQRVSKGRVRIWPEQEMTQFRVLDTRWRFCLNTAERGATRAATAIL
jgi:hypothetical protein